MEQVTSLKALSTKATSTLSDMPKGTRNVHSKEDIILKMLDLDNEINTDIDELIDLKHEIVGVIKGVPDVRFRTLLELRYLCFKSWEHIAVDMGYGIDNIFRLHKKALNSVIIPERIQ